MENKWLDHKIVENLFKVLDAFWPEIFPQRTSIDRKKNIFFIITINKRNKWGGHSEKNHKFIRLHQYY